jgi:putative DNA primase/helicase
VPETSTQTIEQIRNQVNERVREEEEYLVDPAPTPAADLVTGDLVAQCLANNERGDGILYATMQRDRFVFVKNAQGWMEWAGHHWQIDKSDRHMTAVEEVAVAYLNEALKLNKPIERAEDKKAKAVEREKKAKKEKNETGEAAAKEEIAAADLELSSLKEQKKAYIRRVERLRSLRGARNCAEWAHMVEDPLAIIGDEIDQHPWLLPCDNGVVDLRTGELTPGRPVDYLVKAIPIGYPGFDAKCPEWDAFMASIHPDQEIRDFIQRMMGYAITGFTTEQFIACFTGGGGNGKGVLFNTIMACLGDLSWRIQPELILEQKTTRSSSGASPDILALHGRRFVVASETGENRKISAERVKELTGSDILNGRLLYDKFETNFKPTHTLFLQTNHIPKGIAKDHSLRRRLLLIHFPFFFVQDPEAEAKKDTQLADKYRKADPGLEARLQKELPGVLAWLVRGCAMWQKDGLKPPPQIMASVEELRYSEDLLDQFIDTRCELEDDYELTFKHIYDCFKSWFEEAIDERKDRVTSKREFGKWLDKKGFRRENRGGQAYVYGIRIPMAVG